MKHENHTPVGAFKVRGGLVYFDDLRQREAGVAGSLQPRAGTTASRSPSRRRDTAFTPPSSSRTATASGRTRHARAWRRAHRRGARLPGVVRGRRRLAGTDGWHMVPSFHPLLVRGVATYSLELFRAAPEPRYLVCSDRSRIGNLRSDRGARRARPPHDDRRCRVAAAAPAYARSLALGRLVSHDATTRIADGMACRTPVSRRSTLIRAGVERIVEVTDDRDRRRDARDLRRHPQRGGRRSGLRTRSAPERARPCTRTIRWNRPYRRQCGRRSLHSGPDRICGTIVRVTRVRRKLLLGLIVGLAVIAAGVYFFANRVLDRISSAPRSSSSSRPVSASRSTSARSLRPCSLAWPSISAA